MSLVSNILCRSLESAISVRRTVDFRAAQSLAKLQDKLVQIESGDMIAHLHFYNGKATVTAGGVDTPDLVIRGPVQRVSQALVFDRLDSVQTEGDEETLGLLSEIFVPPLHSDDLEERVVNTVDTCASLVRRSLQSIFDADPKENKKNWGI